MDFMGVASDIAQQLLAEKLQAYQRDRFVKTFDLRVLNRVGANEQFREALQNELIMLERIIAEYERDISEITGE